MRTVPDLALDDADCYTVIAWIDGKKTVYTVTPRHGLVAVGSEAERPLIGYILKLWQHPAKAITASQLHAKLQNINSLDWFHGGLGQRPLGRSPTTCGTR